MLIGVIIGLLVVLSIVILPAVHRRRNARENRNMRNYVRRTY